MGVGVFAKEAVMMFDEVDAEVFELV